MGELLHLADRPEFRASIIQQIADAEEQAEIWQDRAQELRSHLGEIAIAE
jgi:hypothetical protein